MIIAPVTIREQGQFRQMLVEYWGDIVPDAPWLLDPILAEAQFQDRYRWDGGNNHPYWAVVDGRRVGFLMYRIYEDNVTAYIHDFFITATARREGYGTEMLRELLSLLQSWGIARINLSVLADNPIALSFWGAQGFEVAYHRLSRCIDTAKELHGG
jgi:ribosomal protein S18 acetylase RimI-like enzyme